MDLKENRTFSPSEVDFSGYTKGKNNIPWGYLLLYFILSAALCYFYHKKIVVPADWDGVNSLRAVMTFETGKPYQFRLLLPALFWFFKPIDLLYGKLLFSAYNMLALFSVVVVYYKLLCQYFTDKKKLLLFAPVILYPVLWNFVILNGSFQYYDFTAILVSTLGIYFIVKERFGLFLPVIILGLLNKESAAYLIFCYLLFNYRHIFTIKIIARTSLLAAVIIIIKITLGYIFRDNPGGNFEVGYFENMKILSGLFSDRTLFRNAFLNFGGMYVFGILLFLSGWWKKYPDKRKVFVNLTIIPYFIFGIYLTYITEVRVYTELIPMVTTLFLIFLSNFRRLGLEPLNTGGKTD